MVIMDLEKGRKKVIVNTALMFVGQFASKVLVFFFVPFYTSVLSTAEYGISDLLITTSNLVYPFFTLMISTAILRFCLDKKEDPSKIFSVGFWIDLFGFVILTIAAILVFPRFMSKEYIPFFMFYYLADAINALLLNYLRGLNNVKMYSLAGVINTALLIIFNLLFLLYFKFGVKGYLLALILSTGSVDLIICYKAKIWKKIYMPWKIEKTLFKSMFNYCLPLIPNQMSWWISNSSDRYVMRYFRSPGELGIYSVSYKIPTIMTSIGGIFTGAWEISAVEDFGTEKNRKFFSEMYNNYLHLLVILCTIILIFLKPLALLLFKKGFYGAWQYVPVLLYATLFNCMCGFVGSIFTAARKTNSIFVTTVLGALTNIVLNFLLIPSYGAQGAAIATAFSYFVTFISRLFLSRKIISLSINYIKDVIVLGALFLAVICSCINELWCFIICGAVIIFEIKYIFRICKFLWKYIMHKINKE